MSQVEQTILQALQGVAGQSQVKAVCWGVAKEITDTSCTVERFEAPALHDVLLNAIDDDLQSYVTIYPREGSNVLIGIIENQRTQAVVLRCSEVEKLKLKIGDQMLEIDKEGFMFNGGLHNGMVKVKEMVDWMAKIYSDMQTLQTLLKTHPVAGNGSPLALAFTPSVPKPSIEKFENKKIKQ